MQNSIKCLIVSLLFIGSTMCVASDKKNLPSLNTGDAPPRHKGGGNKRTAHTPVATSGFMAKTKQLDEIQKRKDRNAEIKRSKQAQLNKDLTNCISANTSAKDIQELADMLNSFLHYSPDQNS